MYRNADSVTLKNNIPIINHYSIDLLSKSERQLSKFFKCCSKQSFDSNSRCFWTGNKAEEFAEHIKTCHQLVVCSYCQSEKTSEEEIREFAAQDVEQLIDHLTESHGQRVFQCNRCQYRANTSTHIQLHQISTHYHIWSKNNTSIKPEALNDFNNDILKIIFCKPIVNSQDMPHLRSIPQFCPKLDSDLAEKQSFCLFCDYTNEEVMKVFMHCVNKHRDLEVCAYSKENPKPYCFQSDSEPEADESDSNDSDFVEPKPPTNCSKSLAKNFEGLLSFNSKPIPGLNEEVLETFRPQDKGFTNRGFAPSRPKTYNERRPKKYTKFFPKTKVQREESFDSFNENSCPSNDDAFEPNYSDNIPMATPLTVQPIQSPFPSNFGPQLLSTPHPYYPLKPPLPQKSTLSSQPENRPKHKKKNKKFQKLKSNEKLSEMSYGEYKLQQQAIRALTSTPTSGGIPPPISSQIPSDLQQTESELNSDESNYRNNSFKPIKKRVGVSTDTSNKPNVTYPERGRYNEESDAYLELLNERNQKKPKRGLKARFESQKHFELTALTGTKVCGQGLFKCLICPNEPQIRENNISNHLFQEHKTRSSLKCGYCEFIGDKQMIYSHSRVLHPNSDPQIDKFVVPLYQKGSIGLTSGLTIEKPKTTARKSTAGVSKAAKGAKGDLTKKIRDSTYLGPLRNDVTQRKETDIPCQRVYSRSTHSSNMRPKKRQKLAYSSSDSEGLDSDRESEAQNQENFFPSDVEMESDLCSDPHSAIEESFEGYYSDCDSDDQELPKAKKVVSVAKKSTAKASSQNESQVSITLTDEQIPIKYFCVFCTELVIITDKCDAIEHYKTHLNLGYTCLKCPQFCASYSEMASHWKNDHKSTNMDFEDNMTECILNWINSFLDNQIKSADFAENIVPNSTGINIECPLCVRAAAICGDVRARSFDALWKVKLHICKHLDWFPMKCVLCEDSNIMFPQNPYLLMKHLVDCHFTSCENLYNISFRGQKPFNDMKREQMRIIEKNFLRLSLASGEIINAFFHQLMTELDMDYENQLITKYNLRKEIQIKVQRVVQIKSEPIDESLVDVEDGPQEQESDPKTEVKDEDKKDIKLCIKSEFKTEVKSEFKTEYKPEIKDELKAEEEKTNGENEESEDEGIGEAGVQFLSQLYGDDDEDMEPIPSTSGIKRKISSKNDEDIELFTLSSDEEN